MTIIVFLIDTSATMNQRIYLGGRPSLLDVAKSAVEYFVKVRQRTIESRGDRYMLLTFEDPPNNIKAGWKENLQTFMTELKNLQATGLTTLGPALRHTFDVLNVNRMQHGIDTYGQGRCPFYLEPSIIVIITDGGKFSSNSGVTDELKLQGATICPGSELTREPFRWDQRLFGLVLKMSGQPGNEREVGLVPPDDSPIEIMCEATGGRSYAITTHRMLHQCIESIAQKVQAGVVLHFEKHGADPVPIESTKEEDPLGTRWHSTRRMIFVPRSAQKGGFAGGFWPIPESFWPDPSQAVLPPRSAHPNVKFICSPHEPLVIENFPFDKYELEANPLTQYILARKQPNVCWQVYLPNSGRSGSLGQAFGYLKASTTLNCVNLFVMPYNYPTLLPLLQDLLSLYRFKPPPEWRAQFSSYLSSLPPYYLNPLKRALGRIGASSIAAPLQEDPFLSYSVQNYLKKLKAQAKAEYDNTCSAVGARVLLKESSLPSSALKRLNLYKNPYDVPRDQLLEHLSKLRSFFFRPTSSAQGTETLHSQPVAQMGNYQEYLKRMPTPLREIESTPVRQHMFGNPFKIDKRIAIDKIDEADLEPIVGSGAEEGANAPTRKSKRKPGPLPKNYHFVPFATRAPSPSPTYESSPLILKSNEEIYTAPLLPQVESIVNSLESIVSPLGSMSSFGLGDFSHISMSSTTTTIQPLDNFSSNNASNSSSSSSSSSLFPHNPFSEPIVPKIEPIPNHSLYENVNGESGEEEEEEEREKEGEEESSSFKMEVDENEECDLRIDEMEAVAVPTVPIAPLTNSAKLNEGKEDEKLVREVNLRVRIEIFKEIRRPRVRKELLLEQMKKIIGSGETKRKFIKSLEKEAKRFRRNTLAQTFIDEAVRLKYL